MKCVSPAIMRVVLCVEWKRSASSGFKVNSCDSMSCDVIAPIFRPLSSGRRRKSTVMDVPNMTALLGVEMAYSTLSGQTFSTD